jgi:hypothetical protein
MSQSYHSLKHLIMWFFLKILFVISCLLHQVLKIISFLIYYKIQNILTIPKTSQTKTFFIFFLKYLIVKNVFYYYWIRFFFLFFFQNYNSLFTKRFFIFVFFQNYNSLLKDFLFYNKDLFIFFVIINFFLLFQNL